MVFKGDACPKDHGRGWTTPVGSIRGAHVPEKGNTVEVDLILG